MTFEDLDQQLDVVQNASAAPMGLYRFARCLAALLPHLKAAAQHGEPSGENDIAVTFYKSRTPDGSSARQAMFKLQALARIYRKTHRGDEEIFDDLKARFKGLEDALGRVDYFEELSRQVQNFGLDPKVETYLRQRYSEEIDALSTLLLEEGWLQWQGAAVGSPAVADTLNQLDTVEWRKASKDRNKILKFFCKQLLKLEAKSHTLDFDELELGVHEFRRNIRWISIYAQALGGLCQLTGQDTLDSSLSAYHTREILDAPYTRYPHDPQERKSIALDASLMYAFNWLIDAIGDLKDEGQLEEGLTLALAASCNLSDAEAHSRILEQLGSDRVLLTDIPEAVAQLVERFVEEHEIPRRLHDTLDAQRS